MATDHVVSADTATYRRVLGRLATGVTAVTAMATAPGRAQPVGLIVNSLTSVSLDPPLVLFCVGDTSTSWPIIRASGRLCVNILGRDQEPVCAQFLSRAGTRRFLGVDWTLSPGGSPLLADAIAWLDGTVEAEHTVGDHTVVIVRVDDLALQGDGPPLVFFGGRFGQFGP